MPYFRWVTASWRVWVFVSTQSVGVTSFSSGEESTEAAMRPGV